MESLRLSVEHNLNKGTRTESGARSDGGAREMENSRDDQRKVIRLVTCKQWREEVPEQMMNQG